VSALGQNLPWRSRSASSALASGANIGVRSPHFGSGPTAHVNAGRSRPRPNKDFLPWEEASANQAGHSIGLESLNIAPLVRWLRLTRLREHVINPAGPACLHFLQELVVEHLPVCILFAMRIGPFALGKCRVEQDVQMVIIGKQVSVTGPPLAVSFPEFGERRRPALADKSRCPVNKVLDPFGLVGLRRRLLRMRGGSEHNAGQCDRKQK
jgi:hypothetical protein